MIERELVLILCVTKHCPVWSRQNRVEDLVEAENDRERHKVFDRFFVGANLQYCEYVDCLNEDADEKLEHHKEDSQPGVFEVFRVHGDVLKRHWRGSHIGHCKAVEDKHADEPSDLDSPVVCWCVDLVDVFAGIGVHD